MARTLSKYFLISLLIKADDKYLALAESRRSQIPGGTEQQFLECRGVRFVFLHAQVDELFAFRDVELIDGLDQLESVFLG